MARQKLAECILGGSELPEQEGALMRIFAISVIVLWCTLAASAESSQSYHDLIDAANKAIVENNFFEARNQLAGALLKSIEQSAKTSEILGIRNRLAGAYKKTHQVKTAAKLLRSLSLLFAYLQKRTTTQMFGTTLQAVSIATLYAKHERLELPEWTRTV